MNQQDTGLPSKDDEDLTSAIRSSLEKRGVLSSIKAKLRAEIFNTLEGLSNDEGPILEPKVLIAFEIIFDFLESMKLGNSAAVLKDESGCTPNSLSRKFILDELRIKSFDNESAPILALMIEKLMETQDNNVESAL